MREAVFFAFCLAVLAPGCKRCDDGPPSQVPDASASTRAPAVRDTVAHGSIPATDLRTALFHIYPEFRATKVTGGEATLTRTFGFEGDLYQALEGKLGRYKDVGRDGGALTGHADPFRFRATKEGATATLVVTLPLDEDTVGKLIHSPAPLGTETMSLMLPRLEGAKDAREVFRMRLEYVTSRPERADFLARQLMGFFQQGRYQVTEGTWSPDAGSLPERYQVALHNEETGADVALDRDGAKMAIDYIQPLTPR